MSTLSEILFGKKTATPPEEDGSSNSESSAIKGTAEWARQNSGDNAVDDSSVTRTDSPTSDKTDKTDNPVTTNPNGAEKAKTTNDSGNTSEGGYVKILKTLFPGMEKTPEQREKAIKKERRDKIFSALGDGLSALANIYFASQYAPDMSSRSSLSKTTQEKYDKAEEEKKWYMQKKMEAQRFDKADADKEREWKRLLGLDEENRKERERRAKERQEEMDLKKKEFERKKTEDEEKKEKEEKAEEERKAEAKKAAARYKASNRTVFADGNGNEVSIDKNVFFGSLQQVFNQLVADGIGNNSNDERDKELYLMMMSRMTPQQQEDFVKKHWTESPKAKKTMLYLSKLDPVNLQSRYTEDDQNVPDEDNIAPYRRKKENTTDDDNTPPSWRKTN